MTTTIPDPRPAPVERGADGPPHAADSGDAGPIHRFSNAALARGSSVAAALLLAAPPALGQLGQLGRGFGGTGSQSDQLRPPTPSGDPSGPGLMALVLFVLLFAMIVGAMLIPSKRGHQD